MAFLGLLVSTNDIKLNPGKAKAICTWPKLTTLIELGNFIGLLQLFPCFGKTLSARAKLLTDFTRNVLEFGDEVQNVMIRS